MEEKSPVSLSDEVIHRITAEEMVRFEVRERLEKKKSDDFDSPLMKFLNSALGLFLLTTIFVTGAGTLFTYLTQRAKDIEAKQQIEKKLLAEYEWRLTDLDARIAQNAGTQDVETKGVNSIMIYRTTMGIDFPTSAPEFRGVPWSGLIIQLEAFGATEHASEAIVTTRSLTDGPYIAQDTHQRGYFGPGVLEEYSRILHQYHDIAQKKIYGR